MLRLISKGNDHRNSIGKFHSISLICRWLKYINDKTKVENKVVKTKNEREDRQLRGKHIIYI